MTQQLELQDHNSPLAPPPNSNLALAVVALVLGFTPCGIVAIVKATKVDALWNQRHYDEACAAAADAKKWATLALFITLTWVGLVMCGAIVVSILGGSG